MRQSITNFCPICGEEVETLEGVCLMCGEPITHTSNERYEEDEEDEDYDEYEYDDDDDDDEF